MAITSQPLSGDLAVLAAQLGEMQRRLAAVERAQSAATLGTSSIDSGALTINDDTGTPQIVLGLQADGTYAHQALNAAPPPAPSAPVVTQAVHGLIASWDGVMADTSPPPGFTPSASTLQATLIGPGTRPVAGLLAGTTYYVALVVINAAGITGPPSGYVTGVPQEVTDIIPPASITAGMLSFTAAGVNVTINNTGTPPSSPNTGDLWFDGSNNYAMNQWNGTAWVAYQFGTNALQANSITAQLIAANSITAGLIAAGAIDGMVINGLTINGTQINASNLLVSGNTGGIFAYSTGGTTTQTFY